MTSGKCAEMNGISRKLDHYESPNSKGKGKPYGDCVDKDTEDGVEKEKDCPDIGGFLLIDHAVGIQWVHVDGERNVLQHH